MYKVLKYAIKKGHKKICIIDPHDIRPFNVVPTINPIHYKAPAEAVSGDLMDTMRVLWAVKDFSQTGIIQDYLPSIFAAIHASKKTLAETKWFRKNNRIVKMYRDRILSALEPLDDDRMTLEEVFATPALYKGEYRSTARRLKTFQNSTLQLMFGSNDTPISFMDLVSQGYLILVNLDPEGLYGQEHQRLLGTIIINEITYAISRLRNAGWRGVHYLYIDEAGDYATSKLSYILDKKRKSGLRLTLSHQRFDQFSDKDVSSAVYGGTKIKVLFNTASREDRDKMIRMMYGGELSDREISYALSMLKKQYAVIKVSKQPPIVVRIPDLPDVEMDAVKLEEWKTKHYHSQPWYRSTESVREEINNRFAIQPTTGFKTAGKPVHQRLSMDTKAGTGKQNEQSSKREDTSGTSGSSVFDDIANRADVLQQEKRRSNRKDNKPPTKAK